MQHFIDFSQIALSEWNALYSSFCDIINHTDDYKTACSGRVMASLFYEPSTRTSFSFQAAMLRLGGGVFGFNDPSQSSVAKGESLKDTMIMVSGYADVIVCRHPREGAALASSLYSGCPVINAGDGGHLHPSQTLTDLATIMKCRGSIDGLRIGLCGDLKNGRTVHSLIGALSKFNNIQVFLISPRSLAIPVYLRQFMQRNNMNFVEVTSLDATIGQLDALYMTRIQKERFIDPLEYERHKGVYILTAQKLKNAKKELIVLHPLPRVDEIHQSVDSDPRAIYFDQARYGMFIRMALLLELCKVKRHSPNLSFSENTQLCKNPNCITAYEKYLPVLTYENHCTFCDKELG